MVVTRFEAVLFSLSAVTLMLELPLPPLEERLTQSASHCMTQLLEAVMEKLAVAPSDDIRLMSVGVTDRDYPGSSESSPPQAVNVKAPSSITMVMDR